MEVKKFTEAGLNCEIFQIPPFKKGHYFLQLKSLFSADYFFKQVKHFDFKIFDFIYIRRFTLTSYSFLKMLQSIKKQNPNCKILLEIPTYPYDFEYVTYKQRIQLIIDKFFRGKLKHYIDYTIPYSSDDQIWGIPVIKAVNGINCADIPTVAVSEYSSSLQLVAVAQFCRWHGYDRLIRGLYEYYKNNPAKKVYLDLVGDGDESILSDYKKKIIQYNLQEYITYHGRLFGEQLTNVLNKADIGVCSLANHRSNVFLSSELKSREYLARGLPMVSSTKIDVLDDSFPYIHYLPEDESPIDINSIIKFYDKLVQKESRVEQIKNIRQFAEESCDMTITMKPIIDILKGTAV